MNLSIKEGVDQVKVPINVKIVRPRHTAENPGLAYLGPSLKIFM